MIFSSDDKKRLFDFYQKLLDQHGHNTPQGLSWNNEYTQKIRFSILSQIANLENKSILDVGCGFGDLYTFLKESYATFQYKGIDIIPATIKTAKKNHPDINFEELDFNLYEGEHFDVIFASGSLSFKIPDYKKFYFGMIKKMFEKSNIAVGFNMLNKKYHLDDDTFTSYSLAEVYDFCSTLTEKIIIRQDYLPQDFTFYLYH